MALPFHRHSHACEMVGGGLRERTGGPVERGMHGAIGPDFGWREGALG